MNGFCVFKIHSGTNVCTYFVGVVAQVEFCCYALTHYVDLISWLDFLLSVQKNVHK